MTFERELRGGRAGGGPRLWPRSSPCTHRDLCSRPQRTRIPPLPAVHRGTPGSAAFRVSRPPTQLSLCHPSGLRSLLVGSKGCSKARTQDSQAISIHSGPPGVLVASFARFCTSDKCNSAASSSVLLNSLPRPGVGPQRAGWDWGWGEMGPQRYTLGLKEGG